MHDFKRQFFLYAALVHCWSQWFNKKINVQQQTECSFSYTQACIVDLQKCLCLDADGRPTCADLLKHDFFNRDGFSQKFIQELKVKVAKENEKKPLNSKTSAKSDQSSAESSGRASKKKKLKPGEGTKLVRKVRIQACEKGEGIQLVR